MCPHSSYPLSRGVPFDIEDFGIRLSAGIRCPKHDWSFDLIRGIGDRGTYRLTVWEVQIRPATKESTSQSDGSSSENESEVWVRRKQRIG
jgi:nitrite reductase/ring-hydroxylating ferredoxin subunit